MRYVTALVFMLAALSSGKWPETTGQHRNPGQSPYLMAAA